MKEQVCNCVSAFYAGKIDTAIPSLHLWLKQSNQPIDHPWRTFLPPFFMTFLLYPNSNCFSRSMQVPLPPQSHSRPLLELDGITSSSYLESLFYHKDIKRSSHIIFIHIIFLCVNVVYNQSHKFLIEVLRHHIVCYPAQNSAENIALPPSLSYIMPVSMNTLSSK